MDKVDIARAAELTGLSKDAIRKRIRRGTIQAKKDSNGSWLIDVDSLDIAQDTQDSVQDEGRVNVLEVELRSARATIERQDKEIQRLIQLLEDRSDENMRKDSIIMNLANRIPMLPEMGSETKRPWWKIWG